MSSPLLKIVLLCMAINTFTMAIDDDSLITENAASDLQTSATSSKLLNLGGLFGTGNSGRYPNRPGYYPSGNGYYPNSGYPTSGYPSSGYPSSGYPSSGYPSSGYPSSGYPSYGYSSSGYPSSGYPYNSYNPNAGYYPNTGNYPSSSWNAGGGSSYPNSGGYYPSSGTNILGGGNGGYGGYGGNGGLRQYSGYWNRNYEGQRNIGYGYYRDSDRYGLPKNIKIEPYSPNSSRDRDGVAQPYRGYD